MAKVKMDSEHLTVYALSDEDAYYEKFSYKKVGSVFEIHEQANKTIQRTRLRRAP